MSERSREAPPLRADGGLVVVIGAGVAGLSAAYHLSRAGCRALVLEARDRLGGRILTDHAGASTVELGAEFVHGSPRATFELLDAAGVRAEAFHGDHWLRKNGRLVSMPDSSGLHQLMALAQAEPTDRSAESFLEEVSATPELQEPAAWMRNLLMGFDAADPARASLKSLVSSWSGDAGTESEQWHPVGGYRQLVDYMAQRLDPALVEVLTGTPVTAVRWSRTGATVFTDGEAIEARAVVVTVPLSVLQLAPGQSSAIRFDPPLVAKAPALATLAMGPVHRVMLRFAAPVWDEQLGGPVPAGTFFHAPGQPFATFWTSEHKSPWLVAWCGGPPAARLGAGDDAGIVEAAASSARALFPDAPVEEARFHNWQRDPFSLGGYSYVLVGGTNARAELARPLDGVLFFAGEATEAGGEAATVAGAIMSGERAARQVLE